MSDLSPDLRQELAILRNVVMQVGERLARLDEQGEHYRETRAAVSELVERVVRIEERCNDIARNQQQDNQRAGRQEARLSKVERLQAKQNMWLKITAGTVFVSGGSAVGLSTQIGSSILKAIGKM